MSPWWRITSLVVLICTVMLMILYGAAQSNAAVVVWLLNQALEFVASQVLPIVVPLMVLGGLLAVVVPRYVRYMKRSQAETLVNTGVYEFRSGRWRAALNAFDQALRLDPHSAKAFTHRGETYQAEGNHNAALDDFTHALQINPDHHLAYIGRGVSYREMGAYDSALFAFDRAFGDLP